MKFLWKIEVFGENSGFQEQGCFVTKENACGLSAFWFDEDGNKQLKVLHQSKAAKDLKEGERVAKFCVLFACS